MIVTDDDALASAGSPAARARHERERRRPPRQRWRRARAVPRDRLQLPDDRHPGGGRPGPAAAGCRRWSPRRREQAARYRELLADVPGITTDHRPGARHHQLPVVLGAAARGLPRVTQRRAAGARRPTDISPRRGIMAAHLEPAYADDPHIPLPVTERITNDSLILPLHHEVTAEDQERIVSVLASALERRRARMTTCAVAAADRRCRRLRPGDRGRGRRRARRARRCSASSTTTPPSTAAPWTAIDGARPDRRGRRPPRRPGRGVRREPAAVPHPPPARGATRPARRAVRHRRPPRGVDRSRHARSAPARSCSPASSRPRPSQVGRHVAVDARGHPHPRRRDRQLRHLRIRACGSAAAPHRGRRGVPRRRRPGPRGLHHRSRGAHRHGLGRARRRARPARSGSACPARYLRPAPSPCSPRWRPAP